MHCAVTGTNPRRSVKSRDNSRVLSKLEQLPTPTSGWVPVKKMKNLVHKPAFSWHNRFAMKLLRMLGALAFGLYLVGCAGNGTVTGGGGGGFNIVGTPKVEMIFSSGFFPNPGLPTFGDPLNIRTGEQVQFQLVGYTAAGVRTVLTPDFWRTTDLTQTFGVLSANTGVFNASSRQSPGPQVVTARWNDQDISIDYGVKPRQVRIIGSVLNHVTHLPVQYVNLYFYDINGVFLGTSSTAYDGSFHADMPPNVARFQVVNDSLPLTVFRLILHDDTQPVSTFPPDYLNNRNNAGTPIPVAVDTSNMTYRATGVGVECLPILSQSTYVNSDYFLAKPILIIPNGDVDGLGNPVDPALLAVGCTVP